MKHYLFLIGLPLLMACHDDIDMMMPVNCEVACVVPEFNLDTFFLSDLSKEFLPYQGEEDIVFVDEDGNEAVFEPLYPPLNHHFWVTEAEFICTTGTVITYQIVREQYAVSHKCTSLNLQYYLNIYSYPDFDQPMIVDKFHLLFHEPPLDNIIDTSVSIYIITDFRSQQDCLDQNYEHYISVNDAHTVTLLDRTFHQTYSRIQPNELLKELYFNTEYGIVGFKDLEDKLWRFDRIQ